MAIRKMKATLNEMRALLCDDEVIEVGNNFRTECGLFLDFPLYFQWNSTLPMREPGRFIEPDAPATDFRDTLRNTLQGDVDLTNCLLLMNYGNLLDQTQSDHRILQIMPADQATHLVLIIRWPVGKPPVYDAALTGPFATKYGALAYQRHEPGAEDSLTPNSCGADAWLLQMSKLGTDCRQSAIARAEASELPIIYAWEDFDLRRAYYRQRFAGYERELSLADIALKYSEDYAELIIDERIAERMRRAGEELPRLWYDECHLGRLENIAREICELHEVLAISEFFAGPHGPFRSIVVRL